jgi:CRP/FNR family transcriptional regulator, anaerobic regulatory protein
MLELSDQVERSSDPGAYGPNPPRRRARENGVASNFANGPIQLVPAREDLFLDGDEADHAFEVLDGIVCAYRILPEGERQIVAFYYPGDFLGYCCIGNHSYSAQALTTVRVRRIPRATLERTIQQKPDVAQRFLRIAGVELTATRDHLACLAAKSAAARIALFLLGLSRRNKILGQDPSHIRLPMTRTDIGDYLGLTIETVSRTLGRMKRKGLIEIPKPSHVIIRDAASLKTPNDI